MAKQYFDIRASLCGIVVALALSSGVSAANEVKIGVLTTLSGGGAILGEEVKKGAELGLEELGGRIGNLNAELIIRDDQMTPSIGREIAAEFVRRENVDFVTGIIWSNVMLAVAPYLIQQEVITVGSVGGPSELAGESCSPYLFVLSNQTAQGGEAMGQYFNREGIDNVFLLAPNYAAGRDIIDGFKYYYEGNIVEEVFTQLGQPDYQAQLTQIRNSSAQAVVAFLPGSMGIQFVRQYDQAGLRDEVPFYGIFVSDVLTLKAQRDAALGNFDVGYWNFDVTTERSRQFVNAYTAKYGSIPSLYAAGTYDAIHFIDDAVRAVDGDLTRKVEMIRHMENWTNSVRGNFSLNDNHFPIQDYLLLRVVQDEDGQYVTETAGTAFVQHKDRYYQECNMDDKMADLNK